MLFASSSAGGCLASRDLMSSEPEPTESAPASDELLVGQKIGKYEIVRPIGQGGMGRVYEAINTAIGKRVAMKFVDGEVAKNRDAVARFQREAQAASAVESAHIVEIFDSGETEEGRPFIVMELLRGEDLGHRIKRCGRLELPEALHIVAQILRGLHRAHKAGIVHRDLKPDNVFLVDRDDDANFAKILDFGISKMQRVGDAPTKTITRQGTVLGTPFYMAPEQAQALPDVDGRSDLWSVGAILYECLSGRPPHTGGTYEQVIVNICMKDAEDIRAHNPAVPEPIAVALAKALARDRADRFGSARQFLDALVTASGGVLSARSGPTSGKNGEVSDPDVTGKVGAVSPSLTPTPARSDEYADTVEVGGGGPSRVGWSTSNGRGLRRDRRMFLLVGAASMALGGTGAILYLQSPPEVVPPGRPGLAADAPETASGVEEGRINPGVDPAEGPRVEPAGSADPTAAPSASAASAEPAPSATASAKAVAGSGKQPVKGPPPSTTPPPPPPLTPPPPPASTGVAGSLQLKTN